MVAIDGHFDALKAAQRAGWREVPGHPDLTPVQAATLMWESFRELARDPASAQRPPDFRDKLTAAEHAADALRTLLREQGGKPRIDAAFQRTTQNCADCHKKYRN
jgi:hypothetical protein